MVTRRKMMTWLAASSACALLPLPAMAATDADPSRPGSRLDTLFSAINPEIDIVNAHTDERVHVHFHGITGYDGDALRRLNHIMRDWREDFVQMIDLRLYWALAALRQAAMQEGHSGQIRLLSGYRSEKTNRLLRQQGYNAARESFHLRARAVDFTMENVNTTALARYAEWLEIGGVGHYQGRFIHIDSGRARRWRG